MDRKPFGRRPLSAYAESLDLQERACEEMPEGTSSNYRGKTAYAPYPMVYMESAEGTTLTDVDGNEYLDLFCGVSTIIAGHRPPNQIEKVREQLDRGPYFATTYERELETAKLVNEIVPGADKTKFISTGTEANMSAVRLARAYTGKDKILKFEGMYHGHTDDMLMDVHPKVENLGTRQNPRKIPSSNGIPKQIRETVEILPWNDLDLLAEKLETEGDEIAAVITEGVMSNCGLIYPNDGYLEGLRRVTREHDVLLILDEVVTGFRMGLGGAQEHFDIEPDLAVFGKALANGYPSAAVTGREEIMDFIQPVPDKADFSGTFSGNPLVIAATKANLEFLRDEGHSGYRDFLERGQRFVNGLRDIVSDSSHNAHVPDFAGFTCMLFSDSEAVEWRDWRDVDNHYRPEKYRQFATAMIGEGVYMVPRPLGRINLTHVHTDEDVGAVLEAAKIAIEQVDG